MSTARRFPREPLSLRSRLSLLFGSGNGPRSPPEVSGVPYVARRFSGGTPPSRIRQATSRAGTPPQGQSWRGAAITLWSYRSYWSSQERGEPG